MTDELTEEEIEELKEDPVKFAEEMLNMSLTPIQKEILRADPEDLSIGAPNND